MELRQQLSARIGITDIRAIIDNLTQSSFNELVACLFVADKRTSDNAAWVLTHAPRQYDSWFAPHLTSMIDEAIHTDSETKCRLMLTILMRQPITLSEQSDSDTPHHNGSTAISLLDFCLAKIIDPATSIGIRSVCIKIANHLSLPYPELQDELLFTLHSINDECKSPAVRCTIRKLDKTKK